MSHSVHPITGRLSRRQFLSATLAVVGGGAAASVLAVAAEPIPAENRAPPEVSPVSQGYRETEHTQAYYRAARF